MLVLTPKSLEKDNRPVPTGVTGHSLDLVTLRSPGSHFLASLRDLLAATSLIHNSLVLKENNKNVNV